MSLYPGQYPFDDVMLIVPYTMDKIYFFGISKPEKTKPTFNISASEWSSYFDSEFKVPDALVVSLFGFRMIHSCYFSLPFMKKKLNADSVRARRTCKPRIRDVF